jgi:hypothetical protein
LAFTGSSAAWPAEIITRLAVEPSSRVFVAVCM